MNKTVLITGVTGTIGKATAIEIAKTGAALVLLARNKIRLESVRNEIVLKTGNDNVDILLSDFSAINSVKGAADQFKQKYSRLDALVNIAAVFKSQREITTDNLEMMFAINHLAPFVLTTRLTDLLKASKPARIITITAPSVTKLNFDDLQGEKKFSALNAFGASKMMNLLFTYSLARRLEGTGVSASALHPGLVRSDLTNEMPSILRNITRLMSGKPDNAARMICSLSIGANYPDINGKFYKFSGKELRSSAYSYDKELQDKLWLISEQLSG
jgi:NAD(P)-dependent dehydrogenase (short-subunit alcohol dehydrogenase family)